MTCTESRADHFSEFCKAKNGGRDFNTCDKCGKPSTGQVMIPWVLDVRFCDEHESELLQRFVMQAGEYATQEQDNARKRWSVIADMAETGVA